MTTPDNTWTTGVAWQLTMDDEPVTSSDAAKLVADELGGVIVPTEPETDGSDGIWLCTTHPDPMSTLTETGWIGLDNGGGAAAEAEWPLTSSKTVWVLTQTDEDADTDTWVHATEIGAMKHMKALQGDVEVRASEPIVTPYVEVWNMWIARKATDSADDDYLASWTIERQEMFE